MSLLDGLLLGQEAGENPKRTAPFEEEPGLYEAGNLWLYDNVRLLNTELEHIDEIAGKSHFYAAELDAIEREVERIVMDRKTSVCGVHNEGHMRSAIVPLRWGSPSIVVFSGGFKYHLGERLRDEPFRAARLWRYTWDRQTDLAVSRRGPEKLPTYAFLNRTVDRLIANLANRSRGKAPVYDPLGLGL